MTDEEMYQQLKETDNECMMDAEEWKALRIKQLEREGGNWSS